MSMREMFEKYKISAIPRVAEVVDKLFERGEWDDFIPKLELYDLVLKELYKTGYRSGEHSVECAAISEHLSKKYKTDVTRMTLPTGRKPRGWRYVRLKNVWSD